jgi:hypothetical protein
MDPLALNLTSSQLTHLLDSNKVPLDSHIPAIRQSISDNHTRIKSLNSRIDALQTSLAQLKDHDEAAGGVRKHTAVISAVLRVPPEILCEIFSLTLPWTRRIGDDTVDCPPWHLAGTCTTWRNVSLAYPFLWCSIVITRPSDIDLSIYPLSMIESQLLRSGDVPLQVTFDSHNCKNVDERRLWDALIAHSNHWNTLDLRCRSDYRPLLSLLQGVRGNVSQLEKLVLSLAPPTQDLAEPTACFSIAPNLRKIILNDGPFQPHSPPLLIPWGQITHYRGVYHSDRQFEILLSASNLAECALFFTSTVHRRRDNRLATLPHLKRLYVAPGNFLTCIAAPILHDLFSWGSTCAVLNDFVHRSSCPLTRLVLDRCTTSGSLVALLQSVPALQSLVVVEPYLSSPELQTFCDALSGSADLLPNLTDLAYGSREYLLTSDLVVVVAMARKRLQPISPSSCRLASFRICCRSDQALVHAEIQPLVNEGLDVAMVHVGPELDALMRMDIS